MIVLYWSLKKQGNIEKIISEFIWEDWVGETINLK